MHPLDNPVWHSLTSRHAALGRVREHAARYNAQVAPFAAIDQSVASPGAGSAWAEMVAPGETVLFVGPSPRLDETGWDVAPPVPIAQMVCAAPAAPFEGVLPTELDDRHLDDVLALTALVYPHYFRPRTVDMGRYIGIYDAGVLVAMAGERMGFDGYQEISAVCTHPAHTGRGHAWALVARLGNDAFTSGRLPFLHVANENTRAKALYERLGYVHRTDIALTAVRRRAT